MNKHIKHIAGCLLVAGLLIIEITLLGHLFRPVDNTDTDMAFHAIDAFHSLPKDSVDVIVYGASYAFRGMDSMEMYKQYGIGAYNYACHWQRINTTEIFLEDSLKTQTPRIALIETHHAYWVIKDESVGGEIYYTRGIPASDAKTRYLKQCFGNDPEKYLSYYVPFVAFHQNWNNLKQESFEENCDHTDFIKSMGYCGNDTVYPITIPDWHTFQQEALGDDSKAVLDEMVQACRKKNVKIIFYTIPNSGDYKFSDAMQEYADANGCDYIDLFKHLNEISIDGTTDYMDTVHTNNSGAVKITDYLGKYIKDHYDIEDMRTVKDNLWEKNLENKPVS